MNNKFKLEEVKWVIMDNDRTIIAKGVPRNRYLVFLEDKKDKKRVLYYSSEGMAKNGFSTGFYSSAYYKGNKLIMMKDWDKLNLEAVAVKVITEEV